MDLLEKINRSFGAWYEGLFGGTDDVRPKDILRKILSAMENNRKEGFDSKVYVPNQYILEINVEDEEEKEYLLSFLNKDELEAAIRRYCQQNHYHIRGTLDFTVKEVDESEAVIDRKGEKVRVRCRYDSKVTAPETPAPPSKVNIPVPIPVEERTVASVSLFGEGEDGTVPSMSVGAASLVIYAPDRSPYKHVIARGTVCIGRSPGSGNDIVIDSDGQISKRHARIELDSDGRFTIYDLSSTNGTKVNGRRVENRTLHDGDEIQIGSTRLTFQFANQALLEDSQSNRTPVSTGAASTASSPLAQRVQGSYGGAAARAGEEMGSSSPPQRQLHSRSARLVLTDGIQDVDDFLLASETVIGRGVTNDIVLPDRTIATRHARLCNDGDGYRLEPISEGFESSLNGVLLEPRQTVRVREGDVIGLGSLLLRFESGAS